MYILFFILWVIFNGQLTLEIALFGMAISALIYAFTCKFMDFSLRKDITLCKRFFLFLGYCFVLIWEIIKANVVMAKFIVVKQEYELHPTIFRYRTRLKSKVCRVLLANSITLTPGTITISLIEDELIIHAVDDSLSVEDEGNFIFEELLMKIENAGVKNSERKLEDKEETENA